MKLDFNIEAKWFRKQKRSPIDQFQSRLAAFLQSIGMPVETTPSLADFSGKWYKDREESQMDKYAKQLELMRLGRIQKNTAYHMIHGLDISQDDASAAMTTKFMVVKCPFFKPTERYRLDEEVDMKRRDQRSGSQTCVMRVTDDGVQVDIRWPEPDEGSLTEKYTLPEPGVLHVHSVTRIGESKQDCLQVYRKHEE